MTNWTNTFSGNVVKPATVSYQSLVIAVNTALAWPTETVEGVPYVAAAIDVTASSGGLVLSMPSALNGSTGVASMITNVGANSFTVQDAAGNAIAVIAASQSWVIVLKDNSTLAGQWRAIQMAATTSNANAAALAGAGLQANGATLQTNDVTVSLAVNTLIDSTYRSKVIVWTGAAGTLTLDTLAHVGAGWNCWIVNEGTGVLTVATSGADVINTGVASLTIPVGAAGASLAFRVSADGTNFNVFGGVANPLPPGSGGTGVVNDPSNTLTFTGHFSLGLTLQNTTQITLPTSGTLAILGANTFTGKQSAPQFATAGNISAPSWTTTGLRLALAAATLTDSSSTGTVAAVYADAHKAVTFAAGVATVYTNAYGAYFEVPTAGANVTLTNAWALGADSLKVTGHVNLEGVTSTGATGTGKLVFDTLPALGFATAQQLATVRATDVGAATGGVAKQLFTIPATGDGTENAGDGLYFVRCGVGTGNMAYAVVQQYGGSAPAIMAQNTVGGNALSFSVSGQNVLCTATSNAADMIYSYTRVG